MLRNKSTIGTFVLGFALFALSGCYKDKTVIIDKAPDVSRTVTFSADIQPILKNSCALSSCHVSGAKAPDLAADKAYTAIIGGNYINTAEPEKSKLYLWMAGKEATPMPLSGINNDNNALVLAWIKQGALNN